MKPSSSPSRLLAIVVLATFLLPVASAGSVVWHLARDAGHHVHHVHHLHSAPEAVSGFAVAIGHAADGHGHGHGPHGSGAHEEQDGHDDRGLGAGADVEEAVGEADGQQHHAELRARLENPPRTVNALPTAASADRPAARSRNGVLDHPPAPPPRSLFASHCALLL